jgi:hypothetical protein
MFYEQICEQFFELAPSATDRSVAGLRTPDACNLVAGPGAQRARESLQVPAPPTPSDTDAQAPAAWVLGGAT